MHQLQQPGKLLLSLIHSIILKAKFLSDAVDLHPHFEYAYPCNGLVVHITSCVGCCEHHLCIMLYLAGFGYDGYQAIQITPSTLDTRKEHIA